MHHTKRAKSANATCKRSEYWAAASAKQGQQYERKRLMQTVIPAQKPGVKLEDAWVPVRDSRPRLKKRARTDMQGNRRNVRQTQKLRKPRLSGPKRSHKDESGPILPRLPEHFAEKGKWRKRVRQEPDQGMDNVSTANAQGSGTGDT